MLQCVAVIFSVLQCVAVCCSALQGVAVRCSALQCVAGRCRALQYVPCTLNTKRHMCTMGWLTVAAVCVLCLGWLHVVAV